MPVETNLPPVQAVGFFAAARPPDRAAGEEALRRELQRLQTADMRLLVVSSLVEPGDLNFARQILDAGLPLILLLLKPPENLAKDFPESARGELERILQKAASVEVIPSSSETPLHLARRLVDQIDLLIVLQNGEREGPGAEMIAYATRRGRTVICLAEKSGEIERREMAVSGDLHLEGIEALCGMLDAPPPEPAIPDEVVRYFHACDSEATRFAPQVRRYVLNIVLANALASMVGSVIYSFPPSTVLDNVLTGIKFGAILLGVAIFAVLRHRESQNRWLKLRLQAEICRSLMATWNSPRVIEPCSADELPEMAEVIRSLHYLRVTQPRQMELSLKAFKAHYGVRRIADQYRYFQTQSDSAERTTSRLTPLYWAFSGAALVASGVAIVTPLFFQPGAWANFFLVLVPIVGPLLASWVLAWQAIESVSRKKIRFGEMKRHMHQAMVDLVHCHSWEAVLHVVKKTEKVLLNEVLEWYSFVKLK
jgi:hypothetical protein